MSLVKYQNHHVIILEINLIPPRMVGKRIFLWAFSFLRIGESDVGSDFNFVLGKSH